MPMAKETLDQLKIEAGEKFRIADHSARWLPEAVKDLSKTDRKKRAEEMLEENRTELAEAQELLYADGRHSVLIVFQAMDAAGKDGTIRHVMSGVNPQGCSVSSFKVPSADGVVARLPVALLEGTAGPRHDRDLQPVLLRRGVGGEGAPRDPRQRGPSTRETSTSTSGSTATRTSTTSSSTSPATARRSSSSS